MRQLWWALPIALVIAAGGYYLVREPPAKPGPAVKPRPRTPTSPAGQRAVMKAGIDAPDGATLCDTAFNGIEAADAEAKKLKIRAFWDRIPTRAAFLEACNQLAPEHQKCMAVKYQEFHHEECDQLLFKLKTEDPIGRRLYKLFEAEAGAGEAHETGH